VTNDSIHKLDESWGKEKILLKDRYRKPWVYFKRTSSSISCDNEVEITETTAYGGLSHVWGGVSFLPPNVQKYLPFMSMDEISSILLELTKLLNFSHTNSEVWDLHAQHNFQSTSISTQHVPQLVDEFSNVWNAALAWERLDGTLINFIEGHVTSFEQSKIGQISLKVESTDGTIQVHECEKLFVAAGPFGNAKLILKSQDHLNELHLRDSNVYYQLFLDLSFKQKYTIKMNPSRIFLMRNEAKSYKELYIQFYSVSEQLIESIKFKNWHQPLKMIGRISASFICIGLIFRPCEKSKGIILQSSKVGLFRARVFPAEMKSPCIGLPWSKLIRTGLVPTPFLLRAKVGAGVHSGAYMSIDPHRAKLGLCNEQVSGWNNIHFLGSSNLARIPAGPITLLGLCQSLFVTRNVITEIGK
jgi:hypothetical protein